jgi:hypothetical protein
MDVRWMNIRAASVAAVSTNPVARLSCAPNNAESERPFVFVGDKNMTLWRTTLAAVLLGAAALGAQAQTTVSGVRYADTLDLANQKLVLNGAGIRYRAIIKVYTAGLYLSKKSDTPEAALAAPGAKRMSITMLRDIDSGELGKLFTRGVEDNMDKASMSKLIPGLMRMSQLFSDCKQLKTGETFTIDWIPGTGTVITVPPTCRTSNEPFKEPEFYNALLRIWLGPAPADWKLKEALLGKAA